MQVKEYTYTESYDELMKTIHTHHMDSRTYRIDQIQKTDSIFQAFFVDKGHKHGPEIHYVTNQARIIILNAYSHKMITILNARPAQISRYFLACHLKVPKSIMNCAEQNKQNGIN